MLDFININKSALARATIMRGAGQGSSRAGQEVRRAHPGLDGAKRVLHGLAPDAHDIRSLIQAPLHSVDDSLMLPPLDAALLAGRALRLDRAVGQVLAQ